MKRILFTIVFIFISISFFAQWSTKKDNAPSHWSLALKGGANVFRIWPAESLATTIGWNGGLVAEYTINPNIGFGLEGRFLNYDREFRKADYYGNTIDATVFGSLNLSNLTSPCRNNKFLKKINIYANFGAGAGFYTYKRPEFSHYIDRKVSVLATGGLSVEYDVTNALALILEGQYRYYFRNNLGGKTTSNQRGNDAVSLNFGIRWKIGGGNPRKQHVRNESPCILSPIVVEKPSNSGRNDRELQNKLKATEDENKVIRARLEKLEDDIQSLRTRTNITFILEDELAKLNNNPSITIAFEDMEFNSSSYELDNNSKEILNYLIQALKNNSNWNSIIVQGHADMSGYEELNRVLSEDRARSVKAYLVERGIEESKVSVIGYGSDRPIAPNDTPEGRKKNRRVEFEILR